MPKHQQTQQSKNPETSSQRRSIPANPTHVSNPAAIIQRARINPKSLTSADVLQLQRTIGNRAVGRLLSEIRRPSTVQQAPVQREENQEEEEEIQMKSVVQREESKEEEPLQGKFASGLTGTLQAKEEAPPNKTGMPDHLKSGLENISGRDLSGVRVHYNSSKPAQLNAFAYTQGQEIHVAPGQEKHLPHEGWHAVQQMQGRVKPTMQLKGGVPVNDDEGLEQEADVMGTRALVGTAQAVPVSPPGKLQYDGLATAQFQRNTAQPPVGVLQRVTSAFPKIDESKYNPQFHNTSFLARVNLTPMDNSAGGEKFKSSELWVSDVKISNDRPPTKFGSEGQRSHTVAWSLLRAAIQGLGGQPLNQLIVMLDKLHTELQKPTNSTAAENAFNSQYISLKTGVTTIKNPNIFEDFSSWQLTTSELVGNYVHAYQLSEEATYADGQAVGHGEPRHMATLLTAEHLAKQGWDLGSQLTEIKEAAVGMLDRKARLGHKVTGEILNHWMNDLFLAFPILMSKHEADIVAQLGLSEQDRTNISLALSGKNPTAPLDEVRNKSAMMSMEASETPAEVALPMLNRSTFTANIVLTPNSPGTQRDVDLTTKNAGFLTKQAKLGLAHYQIGQLDVAQLEVADDRPNTRFGVLQRSHTVAWTLVRRHLMHFTGKGAAQLVNFVLNELTTLKTDIDTPEQNSKIGFDAPAQAEEKRQNLAAIVNHANGFPLFRWQTLLSELVETYVTLYQLSRSATYSKEERPKGHGEANAIITLNKTETDLAEGGIPDLKRYFADNQKDILEAAVKLVDATVATSTLKPANWKIAIEHWLHLVKDQYPNVTKLLGFAEAIEAKISVMEPQDELLVGYKTSLSPREKVLINLYENAKYEVKSVPDAFLIDLQSSIRLKLGEFMPPNYNNWAEIIGSLKLGRELTKGWYIHIGEYGKPPKRGTVKNVPDENAIAKLIADTQNYFEAVKKDRSNLITFYANEMLKKAKNKKDSKMEDFINKNFEVIKDALGKGIDEAIELSAVGTFTNYKDWFDIINSIDKEKDVTYTTLMEVI